MTVNTNHVAPARPPVSRHALFQRWVALWDGDLSVGADFVAPTFRLHLPASWVPGEVAGGADLLGWLAGFRAAYSDARATVQVGPVVCGDLMAARWVFTGGYLGGAVGGATALAAAPVRCVVTDILRIEGGRIAECWLSFDPAEMVAGAGSVGR
jgi:hypothetical protein